MDPKRLPYLLLIFGTMAVVPFAQNTAQAGPTLLETRTVFPGAVGFGVETPAGRGGAVIKVTNLDESGPGSFRAALEADGPRIVVFEVGGVINLDGERLRVTNPFVTVAGQTAPSPGITIVRGGISITTHDVLIEHLRVRPGDAEQPKKSGWAPDGISTSGADAYNVVVDHCSVTWAVDENLSASGERTKGPNWTSRRITFSDNIIAEALHDSSHEKGPHSKGSLIHDFCSEIAVIGNLYAHNDQRNPYFKAFTTGVVVNNLIYNPGRSAIRLSYSPGEWTESDLSPRNARVSIVGNVLIHGADTNENLALVRDRGSAYMDDNLAFDRAGNPAPLTAGAVETLPERPSWPTGLRPKKASEVHDFVLANAGARPWDRDAVDRRIVQHVRNREGRIIHTQDEVGGYPDDTMTRRTLDVPEQGVDEWLHSFRTPSDSR